MSGSFSQVVRQRGRHDQGLVAVALVEQRADRTVDQARGQDLLLGGPAFALEEAARDLAGGERLLLVVHGEREEIEAGLRLLLEHDGRPAPWCRRRSPGPRHRPGARSCQSRARACARPTPLPCGTLETCHSYPSSFPTRRSPPSGDSRPPMPLHRQDRVGPLLSPLPSRLLRSRVSRPNATGTGRRDAKRPRREDGAVRSTPETQALDQRICSACCLAT